MTQPIVEQRGLYFEEFTEGQRIVTVGRTVTESDVVAFATLSGDFNQIHTDAHFAAATPFGARIAHGLLGLSIAVGLAVRTGVLEGTVIAFREIENWKFVKPIFFGDTIHAELHVKQTKALRGVGGGLVVIDVEVLNQDQETLQKGTLKMLVAEKPTPSHENS